MITPNKAIALKNSISYKMTFILDVDFDDLFLSDLYKITKNKFNGLDEFLYSIDVLHLLGKVVVDESTGRIKKC